MRAKSKPVESLQVSDLQASPVWRYTNREPGTETMVRPVTGLPVADLAGKVVGTEVVFANGRRPWAQIGNVDAENPRLTEHVVTVSIERDGRWFTLARFHDFDYPERGPEALARFLSLSIDEVFPSPMTSVSTREVKRLPWPERFGRSHVNGSPAHRS